MKRVMNLSSTFVTLVDFPLYNIILVCIYLLTYFFIADISVVVIHKQCWIVGI